MMSGMATWQKSSFSGNGPDNNCVEVAVVGDEIAIRESEAPGTALVATAETFDSLIQRVKRPEFFQPS